VIAALSIVKHQLKMKVQCLKRKSSNLFVNCISSQSNIKQSSTILHMRVAMYGKVRDSVNFFIIHCRNL